MMLMSGLLYILGINALTWALFYLDKRRAIAAAWRIPEKTLISIAVLGGWPAAKHAQRILRHKTRKQPFARVLNSVPVLWGGLALLVWVAEA